jgi:hypothetical protein
VLAEQPGRPAAATAAQQLATLTATPAGRTAVHAAITFIPAVQSALLLAAGHAVGYMQAAGISAAAGSGAADKDPSSKADVDVDQVRGRLRRGRPALLQHCHHLR